MTLLQFSCLPLKKKKLYLLHQTLLTTSRLEIVSESCLFSDPSTEVQEGPHHPAETPTNQTDTTGPSIARSGPQTHYSLSKLGKSKRKKERER